MKSSHSIYSFAAIRISIKAAAAEAAHRVARISIGIGIRSAMEVARIAAHHRRRQVTVTKIRTASTSLLHRRAIITTRAAAAVAAPHPRIKIVVTKIAVAAAVPLAETSTSPLHRHHRARAIRAHRHHRKANIPVRVLVHGMAHHQRIPRPMMVYSLSRSRSHNHIRMSTMIHCSCNSSNSNTFSSSSSYNWNIINNNSSSNSFNSYSYNNNNFSSCNNNNSSINIFKLTAMATKMATRSI